tara:strand:- start:1619 stop:2224 length:606 start_codon:yes stop_codon:yes gene_type:complete
MKPIKINIDKIQNNPDNPRVIKDYKFDKLVKSITEFPEMLKLRPIVVDENNVILGGNMRYKAAVKAGLKEVYAIQAEDLTDKQKQEFVIKDNSNFGEWDWDILANEWDVNELSEWGLDVPIINEKLEVIGDEKPEIEITEEILEEHNYIVFTFDNQLDWQVAKDLLNIKTVAKAGYTDTYMQKGVGRVKKGKDLLKLLNGL